MVKLIGNICVDLRLPISNPLYKVSFIFHVTYEQPIAIGIFILLIVKDIKKEGKITLYHSKLSPIFHFTP